MKHYEVQTRFYDEWENVWQDDGQPTTFESYREAEQAILDLLAMMPDYDNTDYRIVKVGTLEATQ